MPGITTTDGVRLTYLESGDPAGRPILLVAGFKAAAASWKPQLGALEKAGYRVIAFNRRGHGDSEMGPTAATPWTGTGRTSATGSANSS